MLLVECNVLEKVKVINEGTKGGPTRLRLQGKFQQCDEQNNNGRIYPKPILEAQVQAIQEKIGDRSLVGALDHPNNDAIHLSQASHLITKLWLEKDGSVMGECEILSTPNGKIVEALINDGVKIGISSRGVGSVTEGIKGKIVNEDFKLITFDLVSDPSTRGAFPELTESIRENSQRAQEIVSKHKKDRVLLTMLESKISEALKGKRKKLTPKQRKNIDLTKPFGVITSSDLEAARESDEPDRGGRDEQRAMDGEPTKYPPRKGTKRRRREDSSTNIRAAVIEGFKRVCWGDRYDESYGGTLTTPANTPLARHATKRAIKKFMDRQRAKELADSGQTVDQRARVGYVGAKKSVGDSTTIDRFADVIRERCWKGYKPVKGKKPYSKGSCKKEAYEQFGNAILNEFRGKHASARAWKRGGELGVARDKKALKFQGKRDDAQARGRITAPGPGYRDDPDYK
jgi:hypothetical protein